MNQSELQPQSNVDDVHGADGVQPASRQRHRKRTRHGLHTLKSAIRLRGLAAVDSRTAPARAMFAHRDELLTALGGADVVSPQQRALVEMATRLRMLIDHAAAFILEQRSLITRKRAFIPLVREMTGVIDSYTRILVQLGLERRAKPAMTLQDYLAEKYGTGGAQPAQAPASEATVTEAEPSHGDHAARAFERHGDEHEVPAS